ncbi:hypothetical protein MT340_003150 [Staphylococcus sp. NRL 16/872]|uniref:hypothetical protein n=1 Tax=Staphylococcus sp. NRL 16/872 TaxID=2930131 RepID=UPI001FB43BC6|nr:MULTISPECIES: hypothetical protein [unclassified Staphylococcus]MCJ1655749.1 hypothetical protein [Staphylococcus sp. NRL 21/187]MCJ1661566.1 hypothetical protein [Staphylococcus sp. NRL 18/288]MCJ1667479.1 hypothetical protein [Staphylococcus sp. NRL 19/737]WEN69965.1 hypothetical protein MT340_003150 [Staphylococcus sp. NRL 16/872]
MPNSQPPINYQHNLIELLTLIEKIKYYYFMDPKLLNQAIEQFNITIEAYYSETNTHQHENIANPTLLLSPTASTAPFTTYQNLLHSLHQQPLHHFQRGEILCDLHERQRRIHQTYISILSKFNKL